MTLNEIKSAVLAGKTVCWKNNLYEVHAHADRKNFEIVCLSNQHCIGLTWQDGKTMNGEEKDFYIKKK